jgi:N-acetylglutamate synthase-like GNAT family acetyltransferase
LREFIKKYGKYFFEENTEELVKKGYKKVYSKALHEKHKEYLEKIGFRKVDRDLYEKVL